MCRSPQCPGPHVVLEPTGVTKGLSCRDKGGDGPEMPESHPGTGLANMQAHAGTRRHTPGPHGPEHTPCPARLRAVVRLGLGREASAVREPGTADFAPSARGRCSSVLDPWGEVTPTPSRKLGLVSVPLQPQGLARTLGAPRPGDSAHQGLRGRGSPGTWEAGPPGPLNSHPDTISTQVCLHLPVTALGSPLLDPTLVLGQCPSCCVSGPASTALGPPSMWPIRGVWGLQPASVEPPGLLGGIRILHREAGDPARHAGLQVPNSGPWAEDSIFILAQGSLGVSEGR
nr:uncharacterized protein LOC129471237 [Symphalangus syndactylus]